MSRTILLILVGLTAIAIQLLRGHTPLAQLGFRRKSAKGFTIDGRRGGTGWVLVITVASAVVASVTGLMIN